MTTEDAKSYLCMREIPQLFESLMTGLMFYRPEDHVQYLQECLKKIRTEGVEKVRWNLFIEARKKTPLPPIAQAGRPRSQQGGHNKSFVTEVKSLEEQRGSPLPPIGSTAAPADAYATAAGSGKGSLPLPNCPIILAMGGPGSGKATQCKMLTDRYAGFVHLSMGDLLRQQILDQGSSSDKWAAIGTLLSKGELAPDDMTADLITDNLRKHMSAKGLVIEGYPRTMDQMAEYMQLIGRVDLAFVLDCEEQYLMQRILARGADTGRVDDNVTAAASRLLFFKDSTLPVIKAMDDMCKLGVLDGDRDSHEIFFDLATMVDSVFFAAPAPTAPAAAAAAPAAAAAAGGAKMPHPPTSPRSPGSRPASTRLVRSQSGNSRGGSGFKRVPTLLDIKIADTGRQGSMPTCPILLLISGPGCMRSTIASKLAQENPGIAHLAVGELIRLAITANTGDSKWDKVRSAVNSGEMADMDTVAEVVQAAMAGMSSDTSAILIDGFPRSKDQLEHFNKLIGGLTAAVLLDCDEGSMRAQLAKSHADGREDRSEAAINARVQFYKHQTLPVLGHLDDLGKLSVVNAEQNVEDVLEEIKYVFKLYTSNGDSSSMLANRPPSARVDPPDTGRKAGLISCPVISVISAPGCGVDNYISKVAARFPAFGQVDMAGKCMEELKLVMATHVTDQGLIIANFPLNQREAYQFHKEIGGLDQVIVLDCAEEVAAQNATAEELRDYKFHTIPVLGYYDDRKRLHVISMAQMKSDEDTVEAMVNAINDTKDKPRVTGDPTEAVPEITMGDIVVVPDTGRKQGLAVCPVVAVMGSAGSAADAVAQKLADHFPGTTLVDCVGLDAEALAGKLSSDAKAVLLKGYPQNPQQVEAFNEKVGGLNGVVLIDATADFCNKNGAEAGQIEEFRNNTIPVLAYYDDFRRLDVIPGDRSADELFDDAQKAVEAILNQAAA